ncbi:MAG TPA: hypothetical protein VID27_05720 [Blastocatellia bacterium]|jgi:hypothetical protein
MTGNAFRATSIYTSGKRGFLNSIKSLMIFCIIAVSAASAKAQKKDIEISTALGSPDVKITRVTNRGIVGDDATLVIRVEWSAQAQQTTTLLGFNASIEVEYADGSKNSRSQSVAASARQADLRVLNKGSNAPRKFAVVLRTEFKFLDANFINRTEEFDLSKSNGFSAAASSATRPAPEAFSISRVRRNAGGCAPAKDCFIIEWGTTPRPSVQLNQVSLNANITYNPGNHTRSAQTNAQATARTTTLAVEELKLVELIGIKVKLTSRVSAFISTSKNTQLAGSF